MPLVGVLVRLWLKSNMESCCWRLAREGEEDAGQMIFFLAGEKKRKKRKGERNASQADDMNDAQKQQQQQQQQQQQHHHPRESGNVCVVVCVRVCLTRVTSSFSPSPPPPSSLHLFQRGGKKGEEDVWPIVVIVPPSLSLRCDRHGCLVSFFSWRIGFAACQGKKKRKVLPHFLVLVTA